MLHVFVDGDLISPDSGWLLRRAPGHVQYEYGQFISFQATQNSNTELKGALDESLPKGCIQN